MSDSPSLIETLKIIFKYCNIYIYVISLQGFTLAEFCSVQVAIVFPRFLPYREILQMHFVSYLYIKDSHRMKAEGLILNAFM